MWKTIQKESNYEVSDKGLVRNKETKNIKSLRYSRDGYLRVTLYPSGKTYNIHRLVAETFLTKENENLVVNHKDGNKENNSVANLEWCTVSENCIHSYKHGLSKNVPPTKLKKVPEELIRRIRYGDLQGVSKEELSERFDFHPVTFRDVINFKTYTKI